MAKIDELLAKNKEKMIKGLVKTKKVDPKTITDNQLKEQLQKGWFVKDNDELLCAVCGILAGSKDDKPRYSCCLNCNQEFKS